MKVVTVIINSRFLKVSLLCAGLLGICTLSQLPASAASCSDNDVMRCGATSVSEFVAKYNADGPGDLKTIYQQFGLSPDEIGRFASTAKIGTAFKDGRMMVDGQVVATEANSLGRTTLGGKNNVPITIGGQTYHWGSNSRNFGSDSLPTLVMMNPDTHEMEFAALTACGNPVFAKSPKFKCLMLNQEQIDRDTFAFFTTALADGGTTVSRVVYDFGDGHTETRANPAEKVTHTYAKPGNYTAKVTVFFSVNGHEESDTRKECATPVEVKPEAPKPVFACTSLSARKITRTTYEFTATAQAQGGATLKNADFAFGDGQGAEGIAPRNATTVVIEHEYAKESPYTVTATVNFNVADRITSETCSVNITVAQQLPKECKPGIPENDVRCQEKPPALPSTGPTEIIGGAFGIGSIVTAGGYYLRSRRDLLNTIFKR